MKPSKWLTLFILLQIVLFSVLVYLILANKQQGMIGPRGEPGDSAVVNYKLIDDYINKKVSEIPRPKDGVNGTNVTPEQVAAAVSDHLRSNPPASGRNGVDGKDSTVPGPTGETGPPAPKYQQRCRDFTVKKSQVQYKYENEETWKLLYELPHKCDGSPI